MSSFKGRAGGTGDTGELTMACQGHLSVGADVQPQCYRITLPDLCGEQHGHMISAHKAGDIRQQVHISAWSNTKTCVAGFNVECLADGRQEGGKG